MARNPKLNINIDYVTRAVSRFKDEIPDVGIPLLIMKINQMAIEEAESILKYSGPILDAINDELDQNIDQALQIIKKHDLELRVAAATSGSEMVAGNTDTVIMFMKAMFAYAYLQGQKSMKKDDNHDQSIMG